VRQVKIAKNLAKRLSKNEYMMNAVMGQEDRYDIALKAFLRNDKDNDVLKWFKRCCKHADYMECYPLKTP